MKLIYRDSLATLKRILRATGLDGEWRTPNGDHQHQFVADTGEVMNWWRRPEH